MPGDSAIEWTDTTWNPVTGCSHVSPGCEYCYAERLSHRFGRTTKPWGAQYAAENVQLHYDRLNAPLKWTKPRRIFVNSMSDLFHEQVPDDFLAHVLNVMAATPRHTYQILTKRPERMRDVLTNLAVNSEILQVPFWPLPNVWLGVSTEDQQRADERIPWLLDTPAAVRFLSCEPLLGAIDLTHVNLLAEKDRIDGFPWLDALTGIVAGPDDVLPHLDWVIVGGESGPGPDHRKLIVRDGEGGLLIWPQSFDWVRSLRDQCTDTGVAFFFKQWGGTTPKSGGRELDGRTWDEYPQIRGAV